MTHAIEPANLHEISWQTTLFLRHNAPTEWAYLLDTGIQFLLPDEVIKKSNKERATFLARAEADRIRAGELYYIDTEVTDEVTGSGPLLGGIHVLSADMLPSPSGLMLWSRDVSATMSGLPIIACSWGQHGDGVWVSWWSDAVAAAEAFVASGTHTPEQAHAYLSGHGVLAFERERFLPYGVGFRQAQAREGESATTMVEALTETTITTWALIATQRVEVVDIHPERHVKRRLERDGLTVGPVHHITGLRPEKPAAE
ncbi:hypothetical protein AB0D67_36725 [Streptosporangium sp. NPDC048047]|uniref:hypothetical protein n=1 Tax=Streptosporangium sp. NPDC048047 TaxID=3155748 RepID=UPI00341D6BD9